MFYAIASAAWKPGTPLSPSTARAGLFRTRSEARRTALGGPLVALAVRHDGARGTLVPQGTVASGVAPGWAAPAIRNDLGGLTAFASIPAALVRVVPSAEVRADAVPLPSIHRPHRVRSRVATASLPHGREHRGSTRPESPSWKSWRLWSRAGSA